MTTLNIIYLTSDPSACVWLQTKMVTLQKLFNEFWNSNFSKSPASLKLVITKNLLQNPKVLLDGNKPAQDCSLCCLFVFDDKLHDRSNRLHDIRDLSIDGIKIPDWFDLYFPAIPKLCLIKGGNSTPNKWDCLEKMDGRPFADGWSSLFRKWWKAPFWSHIIYYTDRRVDSWHTPGHFGGYAFSSSAFQQDIYEAFGDKSFTADLSVSVEELGDLSEPGAFKSLNEAMERTAKIFGADESFYVTNGTSTSNKALLMTLLRKGEVVLLDRNCHKSVHQAVAISGAIPFYITPQFNSIFGIWEPVRLDHIEKALNAACEFMNSPPRLLIITTCTYEGFLYPVSRIAELCGEKGGIFYCDEAWCSHILFHPYYVTRRGREVTRCDAMHGGAHFSVQSSHKTLAAFSQASMIHVSTKFYELLDGADNQWSWLRDRFKLDNKVSKKCFQHHLMEVLRYWHSTSPNYPMLVTLDRSGVQMRLEGLSRLGNAIRLVDELTERVNNECAKFGRKAIIGSEDILGSKKAKYFKRSGYLRDPTKMILGFTYREDCYFFKEILKKSDIQWEKATATSIEFLVTIGTTDIAFLKLERLLRAHIDRIGIQIGAQSRRGSYIDNGVLVTTPNFALYEASELVILPIAVNGNRICAQMVVPYPPGIPVLLPGTRVTAYAASLINSARKEGEVHGILRQGNQNYIRVLTKESEKKFESSFFSNERKTIEEIQIKQRQGQQGSVL